MEHRRNLSYHLTTEQLLDFLERRLDSVDANVVENHLATGCQSCQDELKWLQNTLKLMVSNIWLDPPVRLHTSAQRIFQEQQKEKPNLAFGEWLKSLWIQPRSLRVGAVTLLILVVISGVLLWSRPANSPEAGIDNVQGLAEIQPAGSDTWSPATGEEALSAGSTVRTGDDSNVTLSFPDNSQVLLAPDTELTILRMNVQTSDSARVIILQQTSGSTHNLVQASSSSASRYEVQTPSATIIVQGTEFTVEVDDAGATRIMVDKGSVAVAAQGTTISLDAGFATTVNVGEPPSLIVTAPTKPAPPEITDSEDNESQESATLASVEPPATATPTPTVVPAILPTASSTTIPSPNPTSPPGQTPPATITSTPASPAPLPTDSEVASPTPPPSPTPKKTKKPPPGQTKTPQPPGNGAKRDSASNHSE